MKLVFGPIQEQWLKSLEEHPERQHKGSLGEGTKDNYKACCLGELALIAGVCEFKGGKITNENSLSTSYPDKWEELGLRSHTGAPLYNENSQALSILNDNVHYTWPDIAKIVRDNPDEYFTKSY